MLSCLICRPTVQTRAIPASGLGSLRHYSNEEATKKDEELSENEKKLTTEIEGLKKETDSLNEKVKELDVSSLLSASGLVSVRFQRLGLYFNASLHKESFFHGRYLSFFFKWSLCLPFWSQCFPYYPCGEF